MTRTEFEQALSPETVQTLRKIQVGFMSGPTLFALLIGFLSTQPHPPATPRAIAMVLALSCAHLAVALGGIAASVIVPNRVFSAKKLQGRAANEWVQAQQTATIMRLGFLEGPALFGLVVCIQAVFAGVLPRYGVYWLNLASLAVLLAVGIATLPTRERLVAWFERSIDTA
ncbi:MAG TPA: hypothetical protein VJ826_01420 [Candidatus Polarisedimenticolaceae bacterium]|nr:hypothetical protein [Candidatus Polarisedimenticolaceae bacterium]